MKKIKYLFLLLCCIALPSFAAESLATPAQNIQEIRLSLDSVWVVMGGILVFFMQAGFALVESGGLQELAYHKLVMLDHLLPQDLPRHSHQSLTPHLLQGSQS